MTFCHLQINKTALAFTFFTILYIFFKQDTLNSIYFKENADIFLHFINYYIHYYYGHISFNEKVDLKIYFL